LQATKEDTMATGETIVKTTCQLWCGAGCGMLVHLQDGRPVKIEGDPDHPVNHGTLCVNGKAALEYLNSPYRLKHPLKRAGAKGAGKWEPVGWDEALDTVACGLNKTKEEYSADSVTFMQGCAKGYGDSYLSRLANAFGSPNIASMSYICFHARLRGMLATYGFMSHPDIEHPPRTVVVWGANPTATCHPEGERIIEAKRRGSTLIVIDPAKTALAAQADVWIRPRPSSDLALALAMLNVIIDEGLYDADFVRDRTVGFEELRRHVQVYLPEMAAGVTRVPAKHIEALARAFASGGPAVIYCGNGQDNNINNYQFNRAAAILRAITGNLDIPGGEIDWVSPEVERGGSPELHLRDLVPLEKRRQRVGAEENVLPNYFSALPQKLVKAMLTSKPYPIRAAFIQGGSFLHTYSNVQEVKKALESLDFLAVSDYFMTPTAELADIVLPVSMFLEIDSLNNAENMPLAGVIQKVAQVGECRSDLEIVNELGKRLGLGQCFWDTEKAALDFLVRPSGLTFDEFRKVGVLTGSKAYHAHVETGFATPSGKVELYSEQLEEWGFDPLPVYHEPPESPFSEPALVAEYPLLLTNSKIPGYVHSGGRQIASLRQGHPQPLVTINGETAQRFGIAAGDWVRISTRRGQIRQKAVLSDEIDPRVIIAEHGWYFPEKEEDLHGWAEANLNVLTGNDPPYARELGSVTLRGILCQIEKAS
jgi:anaerobic selenocysteine-containing dehydrogenase